MDRTSTRREHQDPKPVVVAFCPTTGWWLRPRWEAIAAWVSLSDSTTGCMVIDPTRGPRIVVGSMLVTQMTPDEAEQFGLLGPGRRPLAQSA